MSVGTSARGESSLRSDAWLSTIGAVGGTALSGIASIVIARELGVTARGRWAVISSLSMIVSTVAAVGLPAAVGYGAARIQSVDRARLVQAAVLASFVLGAAAGLVYLGVAAIISPPAPTAAVITGMAIPAGIVCYSVIHGLTLTVSSMRWYATAQLVVAGMTLCVILALAVSTGLTVLLVVVVSAVAQFVGVTTCFVGLRRQLLLGYGLFRERPARALGILRPYIGYALTTFVTLSLTQVVQRVDVLLVNGYRGPHAAGLYAVAVQLTDLMLVVPGALGFVVFRRGAHGSTDHFSEALRVIGWTALFSVGACVLAILLASWAVPLVFGAAYRDAVAPLRWLLPGVIAFSVQSVLSNYLAGRGRPRVVLVAWLSGALFGIIADLFVVPAYGIVGAAVVSSLSYILVTSLHVGAMRRARPSATAPVA